MHIGPWTIDVEQEMIEVRSEALVRDERWTFIDAAGHGHFAGEDDYPTLRWVALPCTMGHGEDCDGEGHYECPLCSQKIMPGLRPPAALVNLVPGRLYMKLIFDDGRSRREYALPTEADAKAIMNDPIEAIPRITATLQPHTVEWRG